MMNYVVEYFQVWLMLVVSGLLLYGFQAVINYALPEDQEMLELLNQTRDIEAQIHHQSRQQN